MTASCCDGYGYQCDVAPMMETYVFDEQDRYSGEYVQYPSTPTMHPGSPPQQRTHTRNNSINGTESGYTGLGLNTHRSSNRDSVDLRTLYDSHHRAARIPNLVCVHDRVVVSEI
uniref:Uncharacterized protein n=1 Tax=Lygus hesperus TaxID=30085 RepID=A0A146M2Z9_LYGHE